MLEDDQESALEGEAAVLKAAAISFFDLNGIDYSYLTNEEIQTFGSYVGTTDCPDDDPDCIKDEMWNSMFGGAFEGLSDQVKELVSWVLSISQKLEPKLDLTSSCNTKKFIDDETTFFWGFASGIYDWGCSHKELLDADTYLAVLEFFNEEDLLDQLVEGLKDTGIQIIDESLDNDGLLGYHGAQSILAVVELAEVVSLIKNIPKSAGKIRKFADKVKKLANGVDDIPSLIAKWDNITITEAKSLYSKLSKTDVLGSKTVVSQSEILAEINASSSLVNPYNFAHSIDDIVLSQEALFVRVHNAGNPNRPWIIAIEDFQKFKSQDDMIKKLALPILDNSGNVIKPTQISIVKVPTGTKIRKSVARPQDWPGQGHQPGGATQFEIRDQRAKIEWFKKIGSVSDYLN